MQSTNVPHSSKEGHHLPQPPGVGHPASHTSTPPAAALNHAPSGTDDSPFLLLFVRLCNGCWRF